MVHKLPKPMVHIRCGTCFYDMTWSQVLDGFECTYCLTKLHCNLDGTFKTVYTSSNSVPCGEPPAESYRKIRHLRLNNNKERYFVVFSYIFYPCSLPKGHASPHYYHYSCRYSEESLEHKEYKAIDLDTEE